MVIERGRPLIIDIDFDPGWSGIRKRFESKASDFDQIPDYVQRVFDRGPEWFVASSATQLLKIASGIRKTDSFALSSRCYVHFNGDIRPYPAFSLGHDEQKIILLKNSFHAASQKRSDLSRKERAEFLDSLRGNHRASAFPRLLYFQPSKNTREDEREGLPLLFDRSVNCGPGPRDWSGDFIVSPVIKAHNQDTRSRIKALEQVGVIAVPRIDLEDFSDAEAAILHDSDPANQFGRIVFGVVNPRQVATRIPENLLD